MTQLRNPAGRSLSNAGFDSYMYDACPSPVVRCGSAHRFSSHVRARRGIFEESPEWRRHYELNAPPSAQKMDAAITKDSRRTSEPNEGKKVHIDTEDETAQTTTPTSKATASSQPQKIPTADTSSKELPHLPVVSRHRLNAGKLKRFVNNNSNKEASSRMQDVPIEKPGNTNSLTKIDLTSWKWGQPKSRKTTGKQGMAARNETSKAKEEEQKQNGSITTAGISELETKYKLERLHKRAALSASWDDLWRSMDDIRGDDFLCPKPLNQSASQPQIGAHGEKVAKTNDTCHAALVMASDASTSSATCKSSELALKKSSDRKPMTITDSRQDSSDTDAAGKKASSQLEAVAGHEVVNMCAHPVAPKRRMTPPPLRWQRIHHMANPSSCELSVVASKSPTSRTNFIGESRRSQRGSTLMSSLKIGCQPSISVTALSTPPSQPLPDIPEMPGTTEAGSRPLCHPSTPDDATYQITPLKPQHGRTASSHDTKIGLAVCAPDPRPIHGNESATKTLSRQDLVKSGQAYRHVSPPRRSDKRNEGFGASGLGRSEKREADSDRPSKKTSFDSSEDSEGRSSHEISSSTELTDSCEEESLRSPGLMKKILLSRIEQTKGLKFRDLARERAARVIASEGADKAQDINSNTQDIAGSDERFGMAGKEQAAPGSPPQVVRQASNRRQAGRSTAQPSVRGQKWGLSCQSMEHGYPSTSSGSNGGQTRPPAMSPSRIIVLAETDPETQMFSASATVGSLSRLNSSSTKFQASPTSPRSPRSPISPCKKEGTQSGRLRTRNAPSIGQPSTPPSRQPQEAESVYSTPHGQSPSQAVSLDQKAGDFQPAKDQSRSMVRRDSFKEEEHQQHQQHQQELLSRLGRENSEIRLAMGLLSRKLEKLSTFVGSSREDGPSTDVSDQPVSAHGSLSIPEHRVHQDIGKATIFDKPGPLQNGDSGGLQLSSPVKRNCGAEDASSAVAADEPAIPRIGTDEVIWNQLDVLNGASLVRRALDL